MADTNRSVVAVRAPSKSKVVAALANDSRNNHGQNLSGSTGVDPFSFVENWYSSPVTQERLARNLYASINQKTQGNYPNEIPEAARAIYEQTAKDTLANALANIGSVAVVDSTKEPEEGFLNRLGLKTSYRGAARNAFNAKRDSIQGVYEPSAHALALFDGDDAATVAAHELDHASGLDDAIGGASFIPQYNQDLLNREREELGDKWWGYLKQPQEIHPEIMGLRYRHSLKPGQVVTPEMIDEWLNKGEDSNLFNKFNKDDVRFLLNTLAQNQQQNQQQNIA